MEDSNAGSMDAARDTAQKIIAICDAYQRAPCQATLNHFLLAVEQLADLAEDIEVKATLKALGS